jgi:cbb3-type cytochrome oxidase subunit 1
MSPLSLRLVRLAFACLGAGIGLGVVFGLNRGQGPLWRPLHAELNLWGWVTLLIYGMAYHLFPRFAARPLASARLAWAQGWLAMAGVALAAIGWLAGALEWPLPRALLIGGGAVEWVAAALFAALIMPLLRVRTGVS